jgi:hypothetical protein
MSPDQSTYGQPIFVIGAPRSGTSILTWCLGQHPNLLGLEESNWMTSLAVDLAVAYRRGSARGERSQFSSMGMQRDQFLQKIGVCINESILGHRRTFENRRRRLAKLGRPHHHAAFKIARHRSDPKSRWVNGTPEYSLGIGGLRKLFPAARFIHLVRDCDLVAASMLSFHRVAGSKLITTEEEAYCYWLSCVRACVTAESAYGSDTVCRIFHQDLIQDPEASIRRILDFAGEAFARTCLEPLAKKINSSNVESGAQRREPPADPGLIEGARELWNSLRKNPASAASVPGAAAVVNEQFESRVDYFHDLDAQYHRTQRVHQRLQLEFTERTEWALRLKKEAAEKTRRIHELQKELSDRTGWALGLGEDVARKDARILDLQQELDERTRWALGLGEDVARKDARILDLQQELDERTRWALSLDEKLARTQACILDLQKELDERTAWALKLQTKNEQNKASSAD